MDREKESPPERLPFCLDDTVGEIVRASQECPGVYYIAARKQDGKFLADEYYVVEKSSPAISKEAMAYGKALFLRELHLNRRVSDVPSREGILSVTEKAAGPPLHMGALYRGAASQPKGICRPIIKGLPQRTGPTELSPGVAGDLSNYSRGHRNRMT